jgi:hypothetical protein
LRPREAPEDGIDDPRIAEGPRLGVTGERRDRCTVRGSKKIVDGSAND